MQGKGPTRRKLRLILAAVAAFFILPNTPANAVVAAATQSSAQTGFVTPVVVSAEGGVVEFSNSDLIPHDMTADGLYLSKKVAKKQPWCKSYPKKGCPLFTTGATLSGEVSELQGLDLVDSGKRYAFVCSLHPSTMKGTLVIP
jgi:plastocyanin